MDVADDDDAYRYQDKTKEPLIAASGERSSASASDRTRTRTIDPYARLIPTIDPYARTIDPYARLIPIACIYFLTAFMVFPISSQVIIEVVCLHFQDGDDCHSEKVSSEASLISLYATLAVTVPSLLLTGPYASIADRFGRKVILSLPCFGLLSMVVAVYLVSRYKPANFLYVLMGANVIMGSCGSVGIFQMGVFTYASDLTEDDKVKRTSLFSLLESCTFIAKIVGPFASGLWANKFGFTSLLLVAIVTSIVGLLYSLSLPESLPKSSAIRKKPMELSPLKTFRNLKTILSYQVPRGKSPIPYLLTATILFLCSVIGNISCIIFYVIHVFKWTSETIGYYLALEGIIQTTSMLCVPIIYDYMMNSRSPGIIWLLVGYIIK